MNSLISNNIHVIQDMSKLYNSFFLYDCKGLKRHAQSLKHDKIELYYAVKANPISCIINTIDSCNIGFDVASIGELTQVLQNTQNCKKNKKIINTGPAKDYQHFQETVNHIDTYIIESKEQLRLLNNIAYDMGIISKAILRVQFKYNNDNENVLGGNNLTAFGMDEQAWIDINLNEFQNIQIIGFHSFQWGNIMDCDELYGIWKFVINKIHYISQKCNITPQVIDLGGGIGIPYNNHIQPIKWSEISCLIDNIAKKTDAKIWLELGRFITAEYGIYASKIVDIKTIDNQDIIILHGGVNHILRPAITHTPFPAYDLKNNGKKEYLIAGPLCTSLDSLGKHYLSQDLSIGDTIIFGNTGAYGFTESMPFFLCHNLPAEIAIMQDDAIRIMREEQKPNLWMV